MIGASWKADSRLSGSDSECARARDLLARRAPARAELHHEARVERGAHVAREQVGAVLAHDVLHVVRARRCEERRSQEQHDVRAEERELRAPAENEAVVPDEEDGVEPTRAAL